MTKKHKEINVIQTYVDISNYLINGKCNNLEEHFEFLYYFTKYVYEFLELQKVPCKIEYNENINFRKEETMGKIIQLINFFETVVMR